MAADINRVVVVGRLTRDAELKYAQSGLQICKFSVANNYRKKSGEEWVEEANFFDLVLMGRRAEALQRYLTKGTQVAVEGQLRQNRWEQDGQRRSKVEIMVDELQLLGGGSRDGGGSRGPAQRSGNYGSGSGSSYDNVSPQDSFEDDVPF